MWNAIWPRNGTFLLVNGEKYFVKNATAYHHVWISSIRRNFKGLNSIMQRFTSLSKQKGKQESLWKSSRDYSVKLTIGLNFQHSIINCWFGLRFGAGGDDKKKWSVFFRRLYRSMWRSSGSVCRRLGNEHHRNNLFRNASFVLVHQNADENSWRSDLILNQIAMFSYNLRLQIT